jgi:dimethylaniline monooxygenase (N-oxide forming)
MRVAIVGAGVAGLVNARALRRFGDDVVVYESRADIGGVWSATRGYPGQRIQNDKRSYALSDLPMPAHYPAHPDRAQVQAYLLEWCRMHGLEGSIRLSTTITAAEHDDVSGGWRITAEGPHGTVIDRADRLIIANGTLSTPNRPELPGAAEFAEAGGRLVDASDLGEDVDLHGVRLVLLGYGKSSTDIAVAAADAAADITVLARSVPWKLPERFGPLSFEHLVMSRLGEHLLWGPYRTLGGRVVHRVDTPVRFAFRALLAARLRAGRHPAPHRSVQRIDHLVTPGFDGLVRSGRVELRTGVRIERLGAGTEGPIVHLDDGSSIPADLLVAATGYRTDLSFLDERTRRRLVDDRGRMQLHRHTLPEHAPHLLFAGWAGSFRSTIASELQSLWIAAYLHGLVEPPRWKHSDGIDPRRAAPTGLSIVDQDAWLQDIGLPVPRSVIAAELLRPQDPVTYAGLLERLAARVETPAPAPEPLGSRAEELRR